MQSLPRLITSLSLCLALVFSLSAVAQSGADDRYNLPSLGDVGASVYSNQQEHELGRLWLMAFRSQVETVDDPLLLDYTENLLYRLASHSELDDRRLELVIVENGTINAFAVPGGVIGVHNGLFLHTENESQLAGVLGHELAHLSQRHFARSVQKARQAAIPTMAGLLAGIVLAATTGTDAGMAAVAAGQAASMQTQLRFSREHEKEADRIGMKTLAAADLDPAGIPSMFEVMQRNARFSNHNIPEFLLTHPLNESRISDSTNRARQYPRKVYTNSADFQLMKARVELHFANNLEGHLTQLRSRDHLRRDADRYATVLTLAKLNRWSEAKAGLKPLLDSEPHRIAYVVLAAEIDAGMGNHKAAIERLRENLAIAPRNYPLTMTLADILHQVGRASDAEAVLSTLIHERPNDPYLWYQLAEIRGLAGDILGVHRARAEYFILNGMLDSADRQLQYAFPLASGQRIEQRRIKERARDVQRLRERLKQF